MHGTERECQFRHALRRQRSVCQENGSDVLCLFEENNGDESCMAQRIATHNPNAAFYAMQLRRSGTYPLWKVDLFKKKFPVTRSF